MFYTLLGLLVASIILFGSFVVVSIYNYRNRFKLEYHLRSHFPYELNYHGRYKDNLYGNIIYVVYFLVVGAFIVLSTTYNNGYLIFALIAGVIALICVSAFVYVPVDFLRVHLLIVAIGFIFSLAFSVSVALASYFTYKDNNSVSMLISFIVSMINSAAYVILILNPKLSHWADMDHETKEDGTVTQVRPKFFVLAFSEWMMMILLIVNLISIFISKI